MLKLVELLHKLDISRVQKAEGLNDDEGAVGSIRYVLVAALPTQNCSYGHRQVYRLIIAVQPTLKNPN